MKARDAIAQAARRLPGDSARLDAELLMAHLLGVERNVLLLKHLDDAADAAAFEALVARRERGEPVAYITGTREFWSLPLRVTPDVLIPRPDSETIVETALGAVPDAARILDLGTGSGALLLAVLHERPGAWGLGIDRSEAAARVARGNAERLGLVERARFFVGDWDSAIDARFDLVLSNPPYIESGEVLPRDVAGYEPHSALFAGADGLGDYRRIVPRLPHLLSPGGVACLEIGHTQSDLVSSMAADAGLTAHLVRDLAGRPRCLKLTN